MGLLSLDEIRVQLKNLLGWELIDKALQKEFVFPTFADAMIFVNEVAQAAEDMDHHPNIGIHYNKVVLSCHTHDLDGITEKDFALAKRAQESEKMVFGDLARG